MIVPNSLKFWPMMCITRLSICNVGFRFYEYGEMLSDKQTLVK